MFPKLMVVVVVVVVVEVVEVVEEDHQKVEVAVEDHLQKRTSSHECHSTDLVPIITTNLQFAESGHPMKGEEVQTLLLDHHYPQL